jgi:DNA-binding MarR family transcriptional regulator
MKIDESTDAAGPRTADPQVAGALRSAQHAVEQALDAALAPLGLTMSLHGALRLLARETGMSAATLARRAGVKPQSAAHAVARLEQLGMVSRTPHPDLPRVLRLRITASGKAALEHASAVVADIEAELTAGMSSAERDRLLEQLDLFTARARELGP